MRYLSRLAMAAILAAAGIGEAAAQSSVALEDRPQDPVAEGLYGPLDMDPSSDLYAKPVEVAPGVWSAIGATQPPTYENAGHNNNLSFVIGEKGVLVVNGGASWRLAEALHAEIKARTDKPALYVVAENGQGHAMLGIGYWNAQGATVIAQEEAAAVFEAEAHAILDAMKGYNRDRAQGTVIGTVDETFEDEMVLDLGGVTARLVNFGPAHSPGDISVVLPERNVIIAGDMAFHVRMPPIFEETDTRAWLESWERFAEVAREMTIIPGHGGPTQFAAVDAGTRVYLEFLRGEVAKILENGGSLQDAYEIDQSQYRDAHTYWELAARNAGRVFEQMEFE
ncbi:MAG: MBL fold metallo-hydrolase [Pseudomonadota bacterium]